MRAPNFATPQEHSAQDCRQSLISLQQLRRQFQFLPAVRSRFPTLVPMPALPQSSTGEARQGGQNRPPEPEPLAPSARPVRISPLPLYLLPLSVPGLASAGSESGGTVANRSEERRVGKE